MGVISEGTTYQSIRIITPSTERFCEESSHIGTVASSPDVGETLEFICCVAYHRRKFFCQLLIISMLSDGQTSCVVSSFQQPSVIHINLINVYFINQGVRDSGTRYIFYGHLSEQNAQIVYEGDVIISGYYPCVYQWHSRCCMNIRITGILYSGRQTRQLCRFRKPVEHEGNTSV